MVQLQVKINDTYYQTDDCDEWRVKKWAMNTNMVQIKFKY